MPVPDHPDPLAAIAGSKFTFGLSAAKRCIVARRLSEGADWPTIGREVGWEPKTLRRYYEHEAVPVHRLNPFSDASFLAQSVVMAAD